VLLASSPRLNRELYPHTHGFPGYEDGDTGNAIPSPCSSLIWLTVKLQTRQYRYRSIYQLQQIPVEDVVIREALTMEETSKQLAQIRVVGLVVETQRPTIIQVRCKLSYNTSPQSPHETEFTIHMRGTTASHWPYESALAKRLPQSTGFPRPESYR